MSGLLARLSGPMRYEFTVTLKPNLYRFTALEQFRLTSDTHESCIRGFKHTTVAELTQSNNVHYHSMVELSSHVHRDNLINRFRQYHKIFGKISCTQLVREDLWKEYLNKSINETEVIIRSDPVLRDDFLCTIRNVPGMSKRITSMNQVFIETDLSK